jgi:uncharacterized protein with gpF-like domain
MYDVEKLTDKELAKLEARLERHYTKAAAELTHTANKYFATFKTRYIKEKKAFEDGKYTQAEFNAWYYSQVARGKRWQSLRDQMAERMTQANKIAQGYINNILPRIYCTASNLTAKDAQYAAAAENITGIRFDLVDERTVKRLMAGSREVRPYKRVEINIPKDVRWNRAKIQDAVLQGILQGDSIDNIAERLQIVTAMNRGQAVCNARTVVTGARSAGKQDRYEDLAEQGCIATKVWNDTHDAMPPEREEHWEASGQEVQYDEPFDVGGEELMYPGDPAGSPWNIYNCRCTMKTGKFKFKSTAKGKVKVR